MSGDTSRIDSALDRTEYRDAPPWFAIHTRSRHEKAVHGELCRHGVEAFLPTVARWSRWKDRRKRIEWPLFPGYCFARFDTASLLSILKCSGVVAVVSNEGQPAPISAGEIEGIRRLVSSHLEYDSCPLIKEGTLVEVIAGPLRDVVGRLVRKGTHARLVLSVDLIGRAVSVEVDAADVRPY